MADSKKSHEQSAGHAEDVKTLHSVGYAQGLSHRMGSFQNFAMSFSLICILAGGICHWTSLLGSRGYDWAAA
jgi:hypothetical protein